MNPRKHKPEPLNFTTKALAHFKHMVSMQGKENKVKLGVKKMGCNGYSYFFEFTSRANITAKPKPECITALTEVMSLFIFPKTAFNSIIKIIAMPIHNPVRGLSIKKGRFFVDECAEWIMRYNIGIENSVLVLEAKPAFAAAAAESSAPAITFF